MKTGSTLPILVLFVYLTSNAQTIGEIHDQADPSDFRYNTKAGERLNEQNRNASEIMATGNVPGFYEFNQNTMKGDPLGNVILSTAIGPTQYDNVLIFKLICEIQNSIIPINYRNKSVKWKPKFTLPKEDKPSWKDTQTDNNGYFKIRFLSNGSAKGKTLELQIRNRVVQVNLQDGPFLYSLSEEECLNRK